MLYEYTESNDGGDALPNLFVVAGSKIVELCGMQSPEQVMTLAQLELANVKTDDTLILVATMATENDMG